METVGERVRRYRRLQRLNQEELADLVGIDRSYLGRIETGTVAQPGIETIERLAKGLKIGVRDLADPRYYADEPVDDWLLGLRRDPRIDSDAKELIERLVRREYEASEKQTKTDTRAG